MKKIIIIAIVSIILIGVIVLGLKILGIGPFSKSPEKVNNTPQIMKSIFFDMKPMTIPVLDNNELAANLMLIIKIETKVPDNNDIYQGSLREKKEKQAALNKHKIEKIMPKIENIFISDLLSFVPRFFKKYDGIDNKVLTQRLLAIANMSLEKGLITNLTITSKLEPPKN